MANRSVYIWKIDKDRYMRRYSEKVFVRFPHDTKNEISFHITTNFLALFQLSIVKNNYVILFISMPISNKLGVR